MRNCSRCWEEIEGSYRYCPWCAAPLRLKLVEFFRAHAGLERDRGKSLRVSRYLGAEAAGRHVRFSVWNEIGETVEATAAVSLDDGEANRLARFLLESQAPSSPCTRSVFRRLRERSLR